MKYFKNKAAHLLLMLASLGTTAQGMINPLYQEAINQGRIEPRNLAKTEQNRKELFETILKITQGRSKDPVQNVIEFLKNEDKAATDTYLYDDWLGFEGLSHLDTYQRHGLIVFLENLKLLRDEEKEKAKPFLDLLKKSKEKNGYAIVRIHDHNEFFLASWNYENNVLNIRANNKPLFISKLLQMITFELCNSVNELLNDFHYAYTLKGCPEGEGVLCEFAESSTALCFEKIESYFKSADLNDILIQYSLKTSPELLSVYNAWNQEKKDANVHQYVEKSQGIVEKGWGTSHTNYYIDEAKKKYRGNLKRLEENIKNSEGASKLRTYGRNMFNEVMFVKNNQKRNDRYEKISKEVKRFLWQPSYSKDDFFNLEKIFDMKLDQTPYFRRFKTRTNQIVNRLFSILNFEDLSTFSELLSKLSRFFGIFYERDIEGDKKFSSEEELSKYYNDLGIENLFSADDEKFYEFINENKKRESKSVNSQDAMNNINIFENAIKKVLNGSSKDNFLNSFVRKFASKIDSVKARFYLEKNIGKILKMIDNIKNEESKLASVDLLDEIRKLIDMVYEYINKNNSINEKELGEIKKEFQFTLLSDNGLFADKPKKIPGVQNGTFPYPDDGNENDPEAIVQGLIDQKKRKFKNVKLGDNKIKEDNKLIDRIQENIDIMGKKISQLDAAKTMKLIRILDGKDFLLDSLEKSSEKKEKIKDLEDRLKKLQTIEDLDQKQQKKKEERNNNFIKDSRKEPALSPEKLDNLRGVLSGGTQQRRALLQILKDRRNKQGFEKFYTHEDKEKDADNVEKINEVGEKINEKIKKDRIERERQRLTSSLNFVKEHGKGEVYGSLINRVSFLNIFMRVLMKHLSDDSVKKLGIIFKNLEASGMEATKYRFYSILRILFLLAYDVEVDPEKLTFVLKDKSQRFNEIIKLIDETINNYSNKEAELKAFFDGENLQAEQFSIPEEVNAVERILKNQNKSVDLKIITDVLKEIADENEKNLA